MYRVFLFVLFVLFSSCATSQKVVPGKPSPSTPSQSPMKVFVAIYEFGPQYAREKPIMQQSSVKEHIAHHEALGERLIGAGPLRFNSNDRVAGIIIFTADDEQQAAQWLRQDPAVVAGLLHATVHEWRVSAIREYSRN